MSVISRNDTLGLELFPVQSFCISVLIIGIRYGESLYKTWTMSPLLIRIKNCLVRNGAMSLNGIEDLQKLEYLNISDSQVKNIYVLSKLKNLQYLTIFNIPVPYSEIQRLRSEHPDMIIVSSYR